MISIYENVNQRDYFSFHDYEYQLDISKQKILLPKTKSLKEGLEESYKWYREHMEEVRKKPYIDFINEHWENVL